MMEQILGFAGRIIDTVFAHITCALIGCDPNAAFVRCRRCGLFFEGDDAKSD